MRRTLIAAMLACAGGAASAAGPIAFGPDLAGAGWKDMTFFGRRAVSFSPSGAAGLNIESEGALSLIWRPLPADFAGAEGAAWRWRVDAGVPPTDLAASGSGDRDIAISFLFADDPDAAADPPTTLRGAMRAGRALIYVWGGDASAGSVLPSPMGGRGQQVVIHPSGTPTGEWQSERVDLRADFRRAFGGDPGPLVGIGVSSDSDSTDTATVASIADLVID